MTKNIHDADVAMDPVLYYKMLEHNQMISEGLFDTSGIQSQEHDRPELKAANNDLLSDEMRAANKDKIMAFLKQKDGWKASVEAYVAVTKLAPTPLTLEDRQVFNDCFEKRHKAGFDHTYSDNSLSYHVEFNVAKNYPGALVVGGEAYIFRTNLGLSMVENLKEMLSMESNRLYQQGAEATGDRQAFHAKLIDRMHELETSVKPREKLDELTSLKYQDEHIRMARGELRMAQGELIFDDEEMRLKLDKKLTELDKKVEKAEKEFKKMPFPPDANLEAITIQEVKEIYQQALSRDLDPLRTVYEKPQNFVTPLKPNQEATAQEHINLSQQIGFGVANVDILTAHSSSPLATTAKPASQTRQLP